MEKTTILIVDDDTGVRKLLKRFLLARNHEVCEARNGKDALEKMFKYTPDVILLDVKMPVMNGIETYRCLKKDTRSHNIPVIFCTSTDGEEVQKIIQATDDLILKPFILLELYERIKKRLEK